MKTCIIIDDESKARLLLKSMIEDTTQEMKVAAMCEDLPEGIKAIKKYHPDVIFLDIEMPGRSGLEILDFFEEDEINFEIVFTTGYSEYAIQAFKLSATDYLLKPINPETLKNTVNNILQKNTRDKSLEYKALQQNLLASSAESSEKCLVVNLMNTTKFIRVKDIMMLKAEGSYCEIYLKSGEKLTASKNLKYFEERLLDLPNFLRTHKSNVINLKYVLELDRIDNRIIMENNIDALVSAEKMDSFINRMELLS